MPDLILNKASKSVSITINEQPQPAIPNWFSELVLISQLWMQSGLLTELKTSIRVARGRMGRYEVIDFVLLLLAYGISHQSTLKNLFLEIRPLNKAFTALWDRDDCPSASALSRFLSVINAETVTAMRKLLFNDLLKNGLNLQSMGGLYGRAGNRHIVFDVDATKEVARQRSLPATDNYPPINRRRKSCAPGYIGRKRGEVVRTRTTIGQAHTHEWLGTFGEAGNGDIWKQFHQACSAIAGYLQSHQLNSKIGLIRLDGAYGWARGAFICEQFSLGYLVRCCDYSLLTSLKIEQRLMSIKAENFTQPDTGKSRQIYDIGFIKWNSGKEVSVSVNTRLIVACSDAPTNNSKASIGKRIGNQIYELFVTDRLVEDLSAVDIVSIYYGRGSFEQILSEEDLEQDPDRWCSGNGHGQEFWQLLCQWLWNTRLKLGMVAASPDIRRTLWAEATVIKKIEQSQASSLSLEHLSSQDYKNPLTEQSKTARQLPDLSIQEIIQDNNIKAPYSTNSSAPTPLELTSGQVILVKEAQQALGKFSGKDFHLQNDGTLLCPAGKILNPVERRKEIRQIRIIYRAKASDCSSCLLAKDCRMDTQARTGRCISAVLRPPIDEMSITQSPNLSSNPNADVSLINSQENNFSETNRIIESEPIYWADLPATNLRRFLPDLLRLQQVEIEQAILSAILGLDYQYRQYVQQ